MGVLVSQVEQYVRTARNVLFFREGDTDRINYQVFRAVRDASAIKPLKGIVRYQNKQ
jgi:hypothetical protein